MPYIKPEDRSDIDKHIDKFLEGMSLALGVRVANESAVAGHLNYALTRIMMGMLRGVSDKPKYHTLALFSGVLSHMGMEFYRRVVVPYEDRKAAENGDLAEFVKNFKTPTGGKTP